MHAFILMSSSFPSARGGCTGGANARRRAGCSGFAAQFIDHDALSILLIIPTISTISTVLAIPTIPTIPVTLLRSYHADCLYYADCSYNYA